VTFAHPCDLDRETPSSAPARVKEHNSPNRNVQKPTGPRKNSSTSINAILRETRRARRATVAQHMYASALTASPSRPVSSTAGATNSGRSSSQHPPESNEVTSNRKSTPSSKNVSPTSPTSMHLDTHDPRNVFDCTRLAPGSRRMTVNGAHPATITSLNQNQTRASSSHGVAQLLYPSSVNPSPSPLQVMKDRPDTRNGRSAQPTPEVKPVKTPVITFSGNFSPSTTMISSKSSPSHMLDYTPPVPPLTNLPILQPKPIRPMQGISLNLQVQVAGVADTPSYSTENGKNSGRNQLVKNFRMSTGKISSKGKARSEPRDEENRRFSRELDTAVTSRMEKCSV